MSHYGHSSAATATTAAPIVSASTATMMLDADKIFVGGLSWQTTEESLRYHFEQYGPVASVEVMKDRNTGDPRGFAFVVFSSPETVDLVMKDVGRHEINHKLVDVKRAQARGMAPPSIHEKRQMEMKQQQQNQQQQQQQIQQPLHHTVTGATSSSHTECNKVFVGGLPPAVTKEDLVLRFTMFGTVVDAIVMMDQTNQRSRGFGFVTFDSGTGGAQAAVDAQPIDIHGRMAEVKLATPKGDDGSNQHGNKTRTNKPLVQLGLRAGVSSGTGEFAGLAASYGRSGWRAGYGTLAFGKGAGWGVEGWEADINPEQTGFSFHLPTHRFQNGQPHTKKLKQ